MFRSGALVAGRKPLRTDDSILLYAAVKPVFAIDAYTRRNIGRIGVSPSADTCKAHQRLFTSNLECLVPYYNESHAILVKLGKETGRNRPLPDKGIVRLRGVAFIQA